ncbi:hypothetical protein, partial [Thiolapillus sp.]|uniref:hypothetical protein n=1 Tax=Thiolapillus sp. TaxID=2017437 RepID=UPI003AF84D56
AARRTILSNAAAAIIILLVRESVISREMAGFFVLLRTHTLFSGLLSSIDGILLNTDCRIEFPGY